MKRKKTRILLPIDLRTIICSIVCTLMYKERR